MRPLLLLFALLFTAHHTYCQQYEDFKVENNDLFWRKTYTYDGNEDSLRKLVVSMLKLKPYTSNVIRNEIGYNGEIIHFTMDCRKFGRTYINTPRIYWSGEWRGKFRVEMIKGGYKVTVHALYFENKELPSGHYYRDNQSRKGFYINEVLRKDKLHFKKSVLSDMHLVGLVLQEEFDIKHYAQKELEW
jgi:hypothetical protein